MIIFRYVYIYIYLRQPTIIIVMIVVTTIVGILCCEHHGGWGMLVVYHGSLLDFFRAETWRRRRFCLLMDYCEGAAASGSVFPIGGIATIMAEKKTDSNQQQMNRNNRKYVFLWVNHKIDDDDDDPASNGDDDYRAMTMRWSSSHRVLVTSVVDFCCWMTIMQIQGVVSQCGSYGDHHWLRAQSWSSHRWNPRWTVVNSPSVTRVVPLAHHAILGI